MFTGGIKEIKITKNIKESTAAALLSPPPPQKKLTQKSFTTKLKPGLPYKPP